MMKRLLSILFVVFGLFLFTPVFSGAWVLRRVTLGNCPVVYQGEYKIINGILVAPEGFKVKGRQCTITYIYHMDGNSWIKVIHKKENRYVYVTGKEMEISDNYTLTEEFKGNKTDIYNAIIKSIYDFYTDKATTLPWFSVKYIPSIKDATSSIDHGNLMNDIFYEVTVPAVMNYISELNGTKKGNYTVFLKFINESSAKGYIAYKLKVFGNTTLDSNIHSGKVSIYNKTTSITLDIGTDCSKIDVIKNTTTYNNSTFYSFIVKCGNKKYKFINTTSITITFTKEIRWQHIFQLLDSWGLIVSHIGKSISIKGKDIYCSRCREYTFKKAGFYRLSYDGKPSINNLPILIVKPSLTGIYHTTIYPENKIEEKELFNITASGVGNHLIKIVIGSYSREFIVPEKTTLMGVVRLDFNNNEMYIKYYENGTYIGMDEVASLSSCLHRDCSFPYEIWYDDGYNFSTIKPKLFATSNISIKWAKLGVKLSKASILNELRNPWKITVYNNGPQTAEDVKIQDVSYNASCVSFETPSSRNIFFGENSIFNTYIRILRVDCRPKDYTINFSVYGWNTYIYKYSVKIPISYITFPPNNTLLLSPSIIKIVDKNAGRCYLLIDNTQYNRTCGEGEFIYNMQCKNTTCAFITIAENNNFVYLSSRYIYKISKLRTKQLGIFAPDEIYLGNTPKYLEVDIINDGKSTECYTLDYDPKGCAYIGGILLNNKKIYNLGQKICISPGKIDKWLIKLYPSKYCLVFTDLKLLTSSGEKIDKKILLHSGISKRNIGLSNIRANEKTIYLLIFGAPLLFFIKLISI